MSYQPIGQINDMTCVSEDIVFAAGKNGYLIKTSDGGATWLPKTTGTTQNLIKVRFVNSNVGCILLANKTLKITTDGGNNWSLPFGTNILDFSMVSANVFYVTTFEGELLKTTNSGQTFSTINTTNLIGYIQFINENIGFCGEGVMMRTNDGGLSWSAIGDCDIWPADYGYSHPLFNFINENVGFKIDGNNVYKTSDGGSTYTFLSTVNHHVGKVIAASENVVWLITVDLLLNGQPNFTTRIETIGTDVYREDSDDIFINCAFASPTIGYTSNYGFEMLFKNITGTLLGTKEIELTEKISMYPNPASEQINITFNKKSTEPFAIEIADFLGKKVYSQSYNAINTITIDTKPLSKGVYFLTVSLKEKREMQKIIVN